MSSILRRKTISADQIPEEKESSSSIAHLIRGFNSKGKSSASSTARLVRTKTIKVLNKGVTFKHTLCGTMTPSEPFTNGFALRRSTTISDFSKKPAITDFIMGKEIGNGDFSVVRQAVNRYSKTTVAIKIFEKTTTYGTSKICLKEKEALEKLKHSNIVDLIDYIDTPKKSYLVLEHLQGNSLRSLLKTKKFFTESEFSNTFKGIISALDHCHCNNIAHMQLCADNVIIDTSDTPKIIHFGSSVNASLSMNGTIRKKSKYIAPEVISGEQFSPKAVDVWDAGVLLFYMLAGTYPFSAHNDFELEQNICEGVFNTPSHFSQEAKDLIKRMLDPSPSSRYTAEQVIDDPWFQKFNHVL